MKKNKKIKACEKEKVEICKSVGVERKQDIILIESGIDKMNEDEIRELANSISKENKELREMYFALNTSILKIKQRTFKDLVKIFFQKIENAIDAQMGNLALKFKRG